MASFRKIGASVNAFTSSGETIYYVNTDTILPAVRRLMDIVFLPRFSDEQVNKEATIIGNEIAMHRDDVERALHLSMMDAMFYKHPIKDPVLGTTRSIAKIDAAMLRTIHKTFYHPSRATIVVSGDIDEDDLVNAIADHEAVKNPKKDVFSGTIDYLENADVKNRRIDREYDVKTHKVRVGVKLGFANVLDMTTAKMTEYEYLFLLDNFLGETSLNYQILSQKGLINDTFNFDATVSDTYGYLSLVADTKKPKRLLNHLHDMLDDLPTYTIDHERFAILKKKTIGQFIRIFNSVSSANLFLADHVISSIDVFDLINRLNAMSLEDLKKHVTTFKPSSRVTVHFHQ
jgi:predicted Zn-dependent peptidase